jgi:hypothetical protein
LEIARYSFSPLPGTGLRHDWTGTYTIAFALGVFFSIVCAIAMWLAAPRKVRVVAGSLR